MNARLPRVIQGELHMLTIDSRVLRDNPLGDPWRRELPVYLPPGNSASGLPVILVLAGFSSVGASLLKGTPWEPSLLLRYERLLADGRAARAALVFPDAFTRWGGSQYLNSAATGRYADHLLAEVLPEVEARFGVGGSRARRGVVGKSSGGFGALHLCFESPATFAALASHSGDCAFDLCYRPDFVKLSAAIERHGGLEGFVAAFEQAPRKTPALLGAMNILAMSAAYSPAAGAPLGLELPFEPRTGRLRPEVWQRWLKLDPVERARREGRRLADFALVYLDAGLRDEFHLQYGARQLAEALREQGVAVRHEEFDDGHMGTGYRYDVSLPLVTAALST
ncbi:MAG TPA: alpha/beta hydrolase-fold protein [Planctomycetota bacterium]|nr:alpha/beta hydrolase-fold protein [Planctomycetota bacterium]